MIGAYEQKKYRLADLAVSYGGGAGQRPIGAVYNPLGLALWPRVEGMVIVIVSKRFFVVGRPVVRALHLAGLSSAEARMGFGNGADPGLPAYLGRALGLLLFGIPFGRVGSPVTLPGGHKPFRLQVRM